MAMTAQDLARATRRISILGSTGSVGSNTLDLVRRDPDGFDVVALTAHSNVRGLANQAREFGAELAVIGDSTLYAELKDALAGTGIACAAGPDGLIEAAAAPSEIVMAAIVGAAGLAPTLAAVRRGATVGLANKECLVCAGDVFMAEVGAAGATVLPVDSEHNAIFQVFDFDRADAVERIILTASGGPFRTSSRAEMAAAKPEEAIAHPNWDMGAKISVDSATMMNKGLELIEAFYLFPVEESQVEILIHPQSVVHSMVSYIDGSVLAQLGSPDMRTPIGYVLNWPRRMETPSERLNLAEIGKLTFETPDEQRFPALGLARAALRRAGNTPTVLNAANEEAVGGFLGGKIGFLDIVAIVEETLEAVPGTRALTLDEIVDADSEARAKARALIAER